MLTPSPQMRLTGVRQERRCYAKWVTGGSLSFLPICVKLFAQLIHVTYCYETQEKRKTHVYLFVQDDFFRVLTTSEWLLTQTLASFRIVNYNNLVSIYI